jgi:hypothetical protein
MVDGVDLISNAVPPQKEKLKRGRRSVPSAPTASMNDCRRFSRENVSSLLRILCIVRDTDECNNTQSPFLIPARLHESTSSRLGIEFTIERLSSIYFNSEALVALAFALRFHHPKGTNLFG